MLSYYNRSHSLRRHFTPRDATSTPTRLTMLLLAMLTLSACPEGDTLDENAKNWVVGEEDMKLPVTEDMADQGSTPIEEDMKEPSRVDLGVVEVMDMGRDADDPTPLDMDDMPDAGGEPDMEPPVPPRQCDMSMLQRVTVPSVVSDNLVRGRGKINNTACSRIADGQEKQYLLQIDREVVVDIWTTYQNGESDDFLPILTLNDACEFSDETILSCGGGLGNNFDNRNATIRRRLMPGEYLLMVDERVGGGFNYGEGGDFVLHVDEVDLTSNGTCETAQFLDINAPAHYIELMNPMGDTGSVTSCFSGENMLYYEIEVPANTSVVARASYTAGDRAPFLRMDNSCERDATSLCEQRKWANGNGRVDLANTSDQAQRYILSMDDQERIPFTLTFETAPIAPNSVCEEAIALTSHVPGPTQSWLEAGARGPICNTTDLRRPLFYTIDLPDQHRLFSYALDTSGATQLTHRLGCGDLTMQCLDYLPINRSGATQNVVIQATYNDDYEPGVAQVLSQVVPLAPHSECTQALKLTPGMLLEDQDIRQGTDPFYGCQIVAIDYQPTLYYEVDVQLGGDAYRITATANDPNDTSISLQVVQDADDPTQCYTGGCYAKDDSYFRGSRTAVVDVEASIGGGRDPARAIIAVSASPGLDPEHGIFSIVAEPLNPTP